MYNTDNKQGRRAPAEKGSRNHEEDAREDGKVHGRVLPQLSQGPLLIENRYGRKAKGAVSKRLITSREGQPFIFYDGQPRNNRIGSKPAKHNQAAHEQPAKSDIQIVEMFTGQRGNSSEPRGLFPSGRF